MRLTRRLQGRLCGALAIFVWTAVHGPAQVPVLTEAAPSAATVSVRLMFGLDRFTPQRWDGSVSVSPGRVLRLGGVHFEGRDEIVGPNRWLLTNRVTRYADSTTQRGYDPVHTRQFAMIPNGIVASVEATDGSLIQVETKPGSFAFPLRDLEFGHPLEFLDGLAAAERIPTTTDLTGGNTFNDYPDLTADPSGGIWVSWISYRSERDAVWLARHDGQSWQEPLRVSPEAYPDNFRTEVAVDGDGSVVVVWSGKSPDRTWGLFSRALGSGGLSEITSLASAGENIYHRAVADSLGNVHVAWQGFRDRTSRILHARWDGSSWSREAIVSEPANADSWAPDVASDSKGNIWIGWDGYGAGDFNIYVRRLRSNGGWDAPLQITRSDGFDANVALACDQSDRLWLAWDRGESNWGKDWSSQRFRPGGGAGLYRLRSTKVAVLERNRLREAPEIMDAVPAESRDYVQQARLAVDSEGHVWAMLRSLTSVTSRVDNNWGAGGIWEMLLTRLDANGWLPATKLHATNGRNDTWASSAVDSGGRLWFAWSRDARPFGSPRRAVNRGTPTAQTTHVSYTVIDPSHPAWQGSGRAAL